MDSFNVIPFFLLKISNKVDNVINFKIFLRSTSNEMADREDGNTKI